MNKTPFGKARPGVQANTAHHEHGFRRNHDAGKLAFGYGTEGIDCTIVDISEFGAHVVGHLEQSTIPRGLFLIHLRNKIAYECEVSWIDDDRLGLKFIRQHDLANPTTPEMKAMSEQCSGH